MGKPDPRRAEPTAGPSLGPDILIAVPVRTLQDEYRDAPAEPSDDREPIPDPPGIVARIRERLVRPFDRGGPAA